MTKNNPTAPRPFVFVLMPFKKAFDDIYELGIKDAADAAGAYAERVSDQKYRESIIERITNQINKADIIVADMTGSNPNVLYEVGYAHALNKIVLLISQEAKFPFDLNQRQHIVYGRSIAKLRRELQAWISWAIVEAEKGAGSLLESPFRVQFGATEIPEGKVRKNLPLMELDFTSATETLVIAVRNVSKDFTPTVSHLYFCTSAGAGIGLHDKISVTTKHRETVTTVEHTKPIPTPLDVNTDGINLHYRFGGALPPLPVGAVEKVELPGVFIGDRPEIESIAKFRLLSGRTIHDFPFRLKVKGKPGTSTHHKIGGL